MKKAVYNWMVLLMCFSFLKTHGQTPVIDSLKKEYVKAVNPSEKLEKLLSLCDYHQSIQKDTLYHYAIEAGKLAKNSANKLYEGRAAVILINANLRLGKIDSAETIVNNTLTQYNVKNPETRELFFALSALRVDCFGEKTNYEDAVAALYKIIDLAEQYKNFPALAKNMSTLGVINYNLNHVPEAFTWYFKGLAVCRDDSSFYSPAAVLFINLAETYRWVEKTDSAIYYINKAIPLCKKAGNLFYLANALRVKAGIYKSQKNYSQAEKEMLECILIRQRTEGVLPLSNEQVALASVYMNWGKFDKAIHELTTALALNDSLSSHHKTNPGSEADVLKISYYTTLCKCYKLKGDDKNYAASLEKLIAEKDAFYEANSANAIAELQTKYELQKKESTIIKQKLDLTQKNYLFYGSLIFAAFTLLVFWLLFRNYRRKQHIKMEFALQEEKRNTAQSIIAAEENERKRIAADLHDNIGAYASAIRADVEKISDQGLEKNNAALHNLQQHSQEIINSLRDTIWVLNKENITITGVSDRIKNYLNKLQPTYNHIQFHVHENISNDVKISSQNALNIFRIVQEAVHNAIKHSQCSNISISLNSNENIILKIEDDGNGIAAENEATGGNGLVNMRSRAAEAGFELFMSSPGGKGTVIMLQPATTN